MSLAGWPVYVGGWFEGYVLERAWTHKFEIEGPIRSKFTAPAVPSIRGRPESAASRVRHAPISILGARGWCVHAIPPRHATHFIGL